MFTECKGIYFNISAYLLTGWQMIGKMPIEDWRELTKDERYIALNVMWNVAAERFQWKKGEVQYLECENHIFVFAREKRRWKNAQDQHPKSGTG